MEKIKKFLLSNLHLKLFSLLVAFLLWLNLNYFEKTTFELLVPVEVINLPPNLKIDKVIPNKVNVLVEGNIKNFPKLKFSQIRAFCDASNAKLGKNKLPVIVQIKEEGLRIKKFKPTYVNVFITH